MEVEEDECRIRVLGVKVIRGQDMASGRILDDDAIILGNCIPDLMVDIVML